MRYSVPQMNGSAPNSPDTGSQVWPAQNPQPNFSMARWDWRHSSAPIPPTIAMTRRANAPVPIRNPRSPLARMLIRTVACFLRPPYSLILLSAVISSLTTFSGSGA